MYHKNVLWGSGLVQVCLCICTNRATIFILIRFQVVIKGKVRTWSGKFALKLLKSPLECITWSQQWLVPLIYQEVLLRSGYILHSLLVSTLTDCCKQAASLLQQLLLSTILFTTMHLFSRPTVMCISSAAFEVVYTNLDFSK